MLSEGQQKIWGQLSEEDFIESHQDAIDLSLNRPLITADEVRPWQKSFCRQYDHLSIHLSKARPLLLPFPSFELKAHRNLEAFTILLNKITEHRRLGVFLRLTGRSLDRVEA